MSSLSVQNLGSIPYSQTVVNIGVNAHFSDDYTVESLINGIFTAPVTVTCISGNAIEIDNSNYPEDATVLVRVQFPVGELESDMNYVANVQGCIWFQWTNIPVR